MTISRFEALVSKKYLFNTCNDVFRVRSFFGEWPFTLQLMINLGLKLNLSFLIKISNFLF